MKMVAPTASPAASVAALSRWRRLTKAAVALNRTVGDPMRAGDGLRRST
jgi:hypothetical protein